jgi:hypothetical protein
MMDNDALAKAARFAFYGMGGPDGAKHIGEAVEVMLVSPEIDWFSGGLDRWYLFCLLSQMRAALDPDGDSDMRLELAPRAKGRGRRPDFAHRRERRWREIEAAIRAYRIGKEPGWEKKSTAAEIRAADEMKIGVAAIRKAKTYPEYQQWIEAIEKHARQ